MDTAGFFRYPGTDPLEAGPPGFLEHHGEDDWNVLLDYIETRVFDPGDVVLAAGEHDRALYLLLLGRLEAPSGAVHAITTVGEAAFLDGNARAVTVRAATAGEVARLGYDAFLSLAARRPDLGRAILLDLGRILAARLRQTGPATPGWTG